MTICEFLVFFNPWELARISQLFKASYHLMQAIVNFEILFKTQGIRLTPALVTATKLSASLALQMAANNIVLNSVVKSKRIMGTDFFSNRMVTGTVSTPDMLTLGK